MNDNTEQNGSERAEGQSLLNAGLGIEVIFDANEFFDIAHPGMWETFVVTRLKNAGVPIKGTLLYGGLESGTLTRLDDPCDFGKTKYIWVPNV